MGAIAKITNVGNICYLREKVLPMKSWINSLCVLWVSLALCLTAQARDNSRYVNLFMGTAGDHGQVSPAAQLPLGLASVCPDSKVPSHAGYDYDVPER